MNDQITAADVAQFIELARTHAWVAFWALVVGLVVRLAKSDRAVQWFPVLVQPRWRPWVAVGLGIVGGIAEKLASGRGWIDALAGGVAAGVTPILGHDFIVDSLRNGRDIGVKKPPEPPAGSKPPSPPPISIKPPPILVEPPSAPIKITFRALCLLTALIACMPSAPAAEAMALVGGSFECHRKGMALIALGGTCEAKHARIAELVRTDRDCVDLYADAAVHRTPCADGGDPSRLYLDSSYAEGGEAP